MAAKSNLHPRNRHRDRYDFPRLVEARPTLAAFVRPNPLGDTTIDFSDPEAVKELNRAILSAFYGIASWDIPPGYLCPAIPGRADYLHYVADLLAESNEGRVPVGSQVRVLDVGTGANIAYPLIGRSEYGWSFVGSDVDSVALEAAAANLRMNPTAAEKIELRRQPSPRQIFANVVRPGERFDLCVANPPFHASLDEARAGSERKRRNLGKSTTDRLNFGGMTSELVCEGGERGFILRMISESSRFADRIGWFTSLVSKESNLPAIEGALIRANVAERRAIEMSQGQKRSRVVAWRFAP